MNVVLRHAQRVIAIIALIMTGSHSAPASGVERSGSFKLAMGPMSAPQKNQGMTTKPDEVDIKPRHRGKHQRTHHTR